MIPVSPRRPHISSSVSLSKSSRRLTKAALGFESLEERQLLSSARSAPFTDIRYGGALYEIAVNGPGAVQAHRTGHGTVAINLLGTTQDSQVTISALFTHPRPFIKRLAIDHINVRTGRLSSIQGLTTADLMGRISPLQGVVASLQFDALGPAAQVDVNGNLGQLTVNQNVNLGQTGHINVDGNLGTFSVGSNLQTSGGGQIHVLGNLGVLSVTGIVQGKGSKDIVVGDDLGQLTVLGGGNNVFSLQGVNIDVSKNIQGLDVRNGITDSLITAGYLIDGGMPGTGTNGWNIGPDGTLAVFDSQILAGFEIRNITIGGDVKSDLPGNPTSGQFTRIVAGEDRNGNFSAGGIIDNFQIVGRLIDAVLAASVQPYGGTGVEPPTPTPPNYTPPTSTSDDNGFKTYDEPAGTITVGGVTYPTYTGPPYDPSSDPTIDDLVLPGGAINPSFAPAQGAVSPLPSKSTVLGGVVSTAHGDQADFAGIFAANTNGVFVGPLPTS